MSQGTSGASPIAFSLNAVSKSFGETRALQDVTLSVDRGSIAALIGLNGSGKSTLVKVLSGFHSPDSGSIEGGGLAFVHQDLALVPDLTVVENFALGRPFAMKNGRIDWKLERERAREALDPFHLGAMVNVPISEISMAQRAIVAMARALHRAADDGVTGLILDEPTSVLPSGEIEVLAEGMRRAAAMGLGVLFITHRLQEVKSLTDTTTVLRNGTVVASAPTADLSIPDMVELMVGDVRHRRDAVDAGAVPHTGTPTVLLRGESLTTDELTGLDFTASAGEIVGVFGTPGSGVTQLGGILSGREMPDSGEVTCDAPGDSGGHLWQRVGYVPADRARRSTLPGRSVAENIGIGRLNDLLVRGVLSRKAERTLAQEWIGKLGIKTHSPDTDIADLSGGNQQKAVLSRCLATNPSVIIGEEPTQGVDVWAKDDILRQLRVATVAGAAVVLTSVEPDEIIDFCDRVVVLKNGKTVLDERRTDVHLADVLSAMH